MCNQIREQYDLAAKNWYIKYGDMGVHHKAEDALMKQKHRMASVQQSHLPSEIVFRCLP